MFAYYIGRQRLLRGNIQVLCWLFLSLLYWEISFSKDDDFSSEGRCSADLEGDVDDLFFAPDYCPSDVAWLVVLGLCSYLVLCFPKH